MYMLLLWNDNSGYEMFRSWLENTFEHPNLIHGIILTVCAILFIVVLIGAHNLKDEGDELEWEKWKKRNQKRWQ